MIFWKSQDSFSKEVQANIHMNLWIHSQQAKPKMLSAREKHAICKWAWAELWNVLKETQLGSLIPIEAHFNLRVKNVTCIYIRKNKLKFKIRNSNCDINLYVKEFKSQSKCQNNDRWDYERNSFWERNSCNYSKAAICEEEMFWGGRNFEKSIANKQSELWVEMSCARQSYIVRFATT